MNSWIYFILSFVSGLVVGCGFAFFRLKTKIRLYRVFIQNRLGVAEPRSVPVHAGRVR